MSYLLNHMTADPQTLTNGRGRCPLRDAQSLTGGSAIRARLLGSSDRYLRYLPPVVNKAIKRYRVTLGFRPRPPKPRPAAPAAGRVEGSPGWNTRRPPAWPCSLCPRCHRAQAGPGSAAERGLRARLSRGRTPTRGRPPDPGGSSGQTRAGDFRLRPVAGRTRCAPPRGSLPPFSRAAATSWRARS